MVRSPAAASRKRRIDSSSAELEEQPVTSPRKSKLRRVSVPSPESSNEDAEGEEVEQDINEEEDQSALEPGGSSASASKAGSEGEEDAEYEEKYKVWEMFADQYHDIVEQLPLELQRSFQLMLEHDEQMRAHQRALQNATKEYLHLAKSDAYQDAMIKSQLARKIAANLGTTDVFHAQVPSSTPIVTTEGALPTVAATGLEGPPTSNGGVDAAEQASNSSETEVQNTLIRVPSPGKTHETSTVSATQDAKAEENTAEHMRKLLGDIVTHSRAAIKAGDDKVALAVTAYSWVDRHIHRLDSDLMKHEEALSLGLRPGTQPSGDAREALGHAEENADTSHMQDPAGLAGGGKGALPYDTHVHHNSTQTQKKKGKSKSASLPLGELPVTVHTSDADGEKYCYCQQASHDIMVGCDNPQCKLQWFHLACLNMSAPPEVEPWYCPECAPLMQKKSKKKKSSRR